LDPFLNELFGGYEVLSSTPFRRFQEIGDFSGFEEGKKTVDEPFLRDCLDKRGGLKV